MGHERTPTGGQLLGHIVDAFQLLDVIERPVRDAIGKNGQRLLASGCSIRQPCGIICLLGWVFVGAPECQCGGSSTPPQVFEPIVFPRKPSLQLSKHFPLAVHAHALAWDRLVRPRVLEAPDLAGAFVRFAALDLAVKTAVARRRARLPAPLRGAPPAWADRRRSGEPLRDLLDQNRPESLERLAERLGLSVAVIGKWRRGNRRPKSANLKVLLHVLPEQERDAAHAELSRHYALGALFEKIKRRFGEPFAHNIASVYSDIVSSQMTRSRAKLDNDRLRELLDFVDDFKLAFSSWIVPPESFVEIAAHHAPDWVEDVKRASDIWRMPFEGDARLRPFAALNWACTLHGHEPIVPPNLLEMRVRRENA